MSKYAGSPRIIGLPPGADFPRVVAKALIEQQCSEPPESFAKVQIFANAGRMQRRLLDCMADGEARVLPRVHLVSDLLSQVQGAGFPAPIPALDRKLEMARLLAPLLETKSAPAPRASIFDLADSLIALLDEMHTEGVSVETILGLSVEGAPRHWELSKEFLGIVSQYLQATGEAGRDAAALQRAALDVLLARWAKAPPKHPVFVVGSTGSRGTTFELMKAVAHLPNGAVILPGFDTNLPTDLWEQLSHGEVPPEDHAQYRYAAFLEACSVGARDVEIWSENVPTKQRNALVSLSLRPAPVTHAWRVDGPSLGDLMRATETIGLIEAPSQREEAAAIAVAMREALSFGETVALITPDRTLSRRVTSALRRWSIVPDDSGGMPLSLSPPGRLMRHVAKMLGRPVAPADLIALLRHPLTRTGGGDRGNHSRWTNELELSLREAGNPKGLPETVTKQGETEPEAAAWKAWVSDLVERISRPVPKDLSECASRHLEILEALARGADETGSGVLWEKAAGEAARTVLEEFCETHNAEISLSDYCRLVDHSLASENVRETETSRSDVLILGTLEARVLGADLVILGGLNDGIWPAASGADPWLSRTMRRNAGLMSPERQIGLSAHDYQQAMGAKRVVLSRAKRNEDAETVPSRWLNRLANLLDGLPEQSGPQGLENMREKGDRYIAIARSLDAPRRTERPAKRPAPAPPVSVRPTQLSVTTVEKLIRDPYWVYARHVLGLRRLQSLVPEPNAALRGQVFHKVVERWVRELRESETTPCSVRFQEVARSTLDEMVPWIATRRQWMGHLSEISTAFVEAEIERQGRAKNAATEVRGRMELPDADFVITGEADRIDVDESGGVLIYDYKAGSIPTVQQAKQFNPQVLIEAIMVENGSFKGIPPSVAVEGSYLSLGRSGDETRIPFRQDVITKGETIDFRVETAQGDLTKLLQSYSKATQGYPSRRAMEKVRFEGDFDHLARFGEWDDTHWPNVELVK